MFLCLWLHKCEQQVKIRVGQKPVSNTYVFHCLDAYYCLSTLGKVIKNMFFEMHSFKTHKLIFGHHVRFPKYEMYSSLKTFE